MRLVTINDVEYTFVLQTLTKGFYFSYINQLL